MARPASKTNANSPTVITETPLMRQHGAMKAKYPDAILLFRVGDFYETFGDDAIKAAQVLGITLTSRNNGGSDVPLAGFPYHSLDVYLPKLVRAGYRVAICDQLEKPTPGKVVRRGVTEVITPGVRSGDKLLDGAQNNYLASLAVGKENELGVSFLDISTGEFLVAQGDWAYVDNLFQRFTPSEIIFPKKYQKTIAERYSDRYYTFGVDDWAYSHDYGREKLLEHFHTTSLKGFGIEEMTLAQIAAGAALHYLATTENRNLAHLSMIARVQPEKYVWLDRFTIRNLELVVSNHENGKSLLDILDKTASPMGARLLKKWVVLPLKNSAQITKRLEITDFLTQNNDLRTELTKFIREMGDLERLISKVPLGKINPRELRQLVRALSALAPMQTLLQSTENAHLQRLGEGLNPCEMLRQSLDTALVAEPPVNLAKGNVIADGFDAVLDDLRHVMRNGKDLLLDIQQREIEATGITSLKIGFNNVFGYYLEITNKYRDNANIPDTWIRKQTLTTGERFITPELKVLEEKILSAEEKSVDIEERLFQQLTAAILEFIQPIQHNAHLVAILDCLRSFSEVALKNNYVKPVLNDGAALTIREGRHPVIEQQLPIGESYVPNDVCLDNETQQILMITGPNMAGKSALLRQTALICLMAQMGSFVPATAAELSILDKVFTRVGASDNISSGESTFMVEMNETASIMNNISAQSLILLDEIGRGTSTYDGISIAWSIAEFLHESTARPKTLFATHYHELNDLSTRFERVKNFHVATRELNQKVIFLRKLTEGGSEHSFGIHVARMAGMPSYIVERADEILLQLEQKHIENGDVETQTLRKNTHERRERSAQTLRNLPQTLTQLSIFETEDPTWSRVKEQLESININALTPIEAMMKLHQLRELLDK
jgi:DNA mismatch repair protein MutS